MKKRQVLVLALSIMMGMSLLTACGTKEDTSQEPAEEAPVIEETADDSDLSDDNAEIDNSDSEEVVEAPLVEVALTPDDIIASSELDPYPSTVIPDKWFTYYVSYVNDRNLDTAWNEGADGDGVGEYIDFYFPEGTQITGGVFFPGFYDYEELFFENNAITSLELSTGDQSVTLDTTEFANNYSEDYSEKEFNLDEPLVVTDGVLRATIKGVRLGYKYNDACISELTFKGYSVDGSENTDVCSYLHEKDIEMYTGFADVIAKRYLSSIENYKFDCNSMSSEDKAMLLYWYQYHCDNDAIVDEGYEFHKASKDDLYTILCQLVPSATMDDLEVFCNLYVDHMDGDICYMNASGDFGDAGPYYFHDTVSKGMVNGRLKLVCYIEDYNNCNKIVVIWLVPCADSIFGWYIDSIEITDNTEDIHEDGGEQVRSSVSIRSDLLPYLDYTYADYRNEFGTVLDHPVGTLFIGPSAYDDIYISFNYGTISDPCPADDTMVGHVEGETNSILSGYNEGSTSDELYSDFSDTYGNVSMKYQQGSGSAYQINVDYTSYYIDIDGNGSYDITVDVSTDANHVIQSGYDLVWFRRYNEKYDTMN